MIRRPPRSTRTDTRLPDKTLLRSVLQIRREILSQTIERGEVQMLAHAFVRRCIAEFRAAALQYIGKRRVGVLIDALRHARRIFAEPWRSEEHTSELQSLMRTSHAVFCLKKKNKCKT